MLLQVGSGRTFTKSRIYMKYLKIWAWARIKIIATSFPCMTSNPKCNVLFRNYFFAFTEEDFEPLKMLQPDWNSRNQMPYLLSQFSTPFMVILKHLKNVFIKPNICDASLCLKMKGLPFTWLQLAKSFLFSASFIILHVVVITGNCLLVLPTPRLFVQYESLAASSNSKQNFFVLQ